MIKRVRLGKDWKQRLKSIHLILSVIWLGAGVSMLVLRFAWSIPHNDDIHARDYAASVIDNRVIIPVAWGALITGFLESWFTTWGFFLYRWVTVKWILTAAIMIYAPLFQSRWSGEMEAISCVEGLAALHNPVYLHYQTLYSVSGLALVSILAFMAVISTLKPWTRHDRTHTASPRRSSVAGHAGAQEP